MIAKSYQFCWHYYRTSFQISFDYSNGAHRDSTGPLKNTTCTNKKIKLVNTITIFHNNFIRLRDLTLVRLVPSAILKIASVWSGVNGLSSATMIRSWWFAIARQSKTLRSSPLWKPSPSHEKRRSKSRAYSKWWPYYHIFHILTDL